MRHVTKAEDRYSFLENIDNSSHRPLLYLALEKTKKLNRTVAEFGMGEGSTKHLHDYCVGEKWLLQSFDNNVEWASRFHYLTCEQHKIECVSWADNIPSRANTWSVVLVDHAPAEQRHVDIAALANKAAIIVIHDSEPRSKGYQLDKIWPLFKHRVDIRVPHPYADATAVSNLIDITEWRGTSFEGYPYKVE